MAVYVVLALAFFEHSSCQAVRDKLMAGLSGTRPASPCASSLSRARRRLGSAPLRSLSGILAGPVATQPQNSSFCRGLRGIAVGGTTFAIPDEKALAWRFPKHAGEVKESGCPLLRLVALAGCGTRALPGAAGGPDTTGELGYAHRLLHHLDPSAVLLADVCCDAFGFLNAVTGTGAAFLPRPARKRRPTMRRPLPDGSCLTTISAGKYKGRTRLRAPGGADRGGSENRHTGRRHPPQRAVARDDQPPGRRALPRPRAHRAVSPQAAR